MGRAKRNQASLKASDGRVNNGRKPGQVVRKQKKYTPAQMNKAKKDRIKVYANNAIIDEWTSEEMFWRWLAEKSRKSNYHLGKLLEYALPDPMEIHGIERTADKVNINFFGNTTISNQEPKQLDVLDIEAEDVTEQEDE